MMGNQTVISAKQNMIPQQITFFNKAFVKQIILGGLHVFFTDYENGNNYQLQFLNET
jgi:hypothetical protein